MTAARTLTEHEQLCLLAEHEPILAFTKGELFFPVSAEAFIGASSLWCVEPERHPYELVPVGQLHPSRLAEEAGGSSDRALQLRFVDRPLRGADYARWRSRPDRDRLEARHRFTRVGVLARFIDALFRLGLLLRGRIPGGFAAAAEQRARQVLAGQPPAYHGRVVTAGGGYIALQYWFFYVMNDWRSTFAGVNDHEGDWELVTVYLADHGDHVEPRWVGLSTHDERGDALRRRWDDPELARHGNHPIVYVGAGSHSGAVLPGDYVVAVDPPIVRPVTSVLSRALAIILPWVDVGKVGLRIPYVDYHRGDGTSIGPGQGSAWHRVLISDETPWVREFRGLWGLDTGDRFGGERAPAGPRYERNGRIRRSWSDPVGWVGLHKVPPTAAHARRVLEARIHALSEEAVELDEAVPALRDQLRGARTAQLLLGVEPSGGNAADVTEREIVAMVERRAAITEEVRVVSARLGDGLPEEHVHAHLTERRQPYATSRGERVRFLRVWATISSPLLVAAMVAILLRPPTGMLTAMGALLLAFFAIEALARRRALAYLGTVFFVGGGLIAAGVLVIVIVVYWRIAGSVLLAVAAMGLLALNVSDLRRR